MPIYTPLPTFVFNVTQIFFRDTISKQLDQTNSKTYNLKSFYLSSDKITSNHDLNMSDMSQEKATITKLLKSC